MSTAWVKPDKPINIPGSRMRQQRKCAVLAFLHMQHHWLSALYIHFWALWRYLTKEVANTLANNLLFTYQADTEQKNLNIF